MATECRTRVLRECHISDTEDKQKHFRKLRHIVKRSPFMNVFEISSENNKVLYYAGISGYGEMWSSSYQWRAVILMLTIFAVFLNKMFG